jgi:tetratricopeptide (TPR) repeat protein
LGLLLAGLSRRDGAEKKYRAALALQEKLVQQFPDVAAHRQESARSHNNLGNLLAVLPRRKKEAETEYRAALVLQEKLVKQSPDVSGYRKELAASHDNLGVLLAGLGRPGEAEAYKEHRAALALRKKLAEQFSAPPSYRQELAASHTNLGLLLVRLRRHGEAEKEHRAALDLLEKMVEQFPALPDYVVDLGGGYVNFGNLEGARGQPQAALPWYDKAIARLQPVLATDRRLARARLFLGNAHAGRALALTQLNRQVESIRDWDRAIELAERPQRHEFRLLYAGNLAQAGQHAHALAQANALAEEKDVPGPTLYSAACLCALAVTIVKEDAKIREQYADRAVALLRQAQKAGYFKEPANIANMKKHSDSGALQTLRARPDYRQLLKELETPAKP